VVLFYRASLLITNDGGPVHFSALTPIPSIVFFGPETPVLYGSLAKNARCFSCRCPARLVSPRTTIGPRPATAITVPEPDRPGTGGRKGAFDARMSYIEALLNSRFIGGSSGIGS